MRKINEIILHCSDSKFGDAALIDAWHKERGWSGIGYHYVILNGRPKGSKSYERDLDGAVQEGRPISKSGAHVRGRNSNSIGVCLIGVRDFTLNQLDAVLNLINELQEKFKLDKSAVKGHCEYDSHKTCPNFRVDLIRKIINNESFPDELNSFK